MAPVRFGNCGVASTGKRNRRRRYTSPVVWSLCTVHMRKYSIAHHGASVTFSRLNLLLALYSGTGESLSARLAPKEKYEVKVALTEG